MKHLHKTPIPLAVMCLLSSPVYALTIENIRASGLNGLQDKQSLILQVLEIKQGSKIEPTQLPELEKKLMDSGFFQSVEAKLEENDLVLNVVEKPLIENVVVEGAKTIRPKTIIDNLKQNEIAQGKVYNPYIMAHFVDTLKDEYINGLGKEDVQIKDESQINANELVDIKLNIAEGKTTRINDIHFNGAKAYSQWKLRRLMMSNQKNLTSAVLQNNKLKPNQLRADLEKVVDFYQNKGYFKSNIEGVDFTVVDAEQKLKDVRIKLHEGDIYHFEKPDVQFNIGENDVDIMPLFQDGKLDQLITIKENSLYRKNDVLETKSNLSDHLSNNGYAFNKIDIDVVPNDEKKTVKFVFKVHSGSQEKIKINQFLVKGNKKTNTPVILREMRQKEGDVFDLSKLQRSKDRLNLTGFFNQVEMETIPVPNQPHLMDIQVDVAERRTGTLQFNAGYMQDYGATFGFAAEDRNFKGTGKELGGQVNYNKTYQNAQLSYTDPYLTASGISLHGNVFGSVYDPRKQKDNNQSYKTSKYGVGLNFGFPVNEYNKIYAGFTTEHLTLNTYDNAPQKYREFIQEHGKNNSGIGKFSGVLVKGTVGWGRNTTNDAYWATKGYISNVNAEITVPSISKLDFYKFNLEHRHFFPIGEKSSLMVMGKAGYANSYRKTSSLPFFENYYGGGLGSVRGFESSTLGPKVYDVDNNIITYGGNKMVAGSLEFQTPVPLMKDTSNVRISAFVDAGSIWDGKTYTAADSDNGYMVDGYESKHHSSFKNEFRASAGLAYTWLSPIGAIKFSYAIPLKKKKEDQLQRFQFQLGTTF